jgi:hypothetical protein
MRFALFAGTCPPSAANKAAGCLVRSALVLVVVRQIVVLSLPKTPSVLTELVEVRQPLL